MSGVASREVFKHLNTLFHCGAAGPLSDEDLLERFVGGDHESAQAAFAALVNRHGAMVLGVCRRVLCNRHAAEDAFQAAFLVLARKAPAIARREQLASWLHGVARRTALDARARAARQKSQEKRLGVMRPVEPPDETQTSELRAILDEELGRLPERHRAALVLCELEGLSRRQAAARLGVTEGTLSSRLARAKARLRDRLTRRGLGLSTAILTSALNQEAHAVAVPLALVDSTIRVATLVAAGTSLTAVASTAVVTLTEGVLKAMLLAKLKSVVLGLAALAVFTTGVGVLAQDGTSDGDRLKNVERKLDRLLEVLGGSIRRAPADAHIAKIPAPATTPPNSSSSPAPAAVPLTPGFAPPPRPPKGSAPESAAAPALDAPQRRRAVSIEATLRERISINMDKQPLSDAITFIQNYTGLNIAVDPKALGDNGLTSASPVSLVVNAIPLKNALQLMLRPLGLTYKAEDEVVLITSPESLAAPVHILERRLGDLERRIGDLERRFQQLDRGASTPANSGEARARTSGNKTMRTFPDRQLGERPSATPSAIPVPMPRDYAPSPFDQEKETPHAVDLPARNLPSKESPPNEPLTDLPQ